MPKIFKFTRVSLRDLIVTAGPVTLLVLALCIAAYWLIDPSPPKRVVLSTGQENSAYQEFGKKYAAVLARQGIAVELRASPGSMENLKRLQDSDSGVDIAFVQSGSTEQAEAERQGLVSLGSLFTEPVWIFLRGHRKVNELSQLKGMRINVGPEGTGVPRLFKRLLDANNIDPAELRLGTLENTPATAALLGGRIDGVVFSSAPDAPLIQMLLQTPGIQLVDFPQAEAYTRRFPFLSHVVLPRGIADLGKNLPARDYHLIAPTATLVAREDLHPALVDLFVQSAAVIHGGTGWFNAQKAFPTASYTEIPVARDAERYYRNGPTFLERYLPFWLANFFSRMWVVIIAMGALAVPLSRIVPPLYVWKVRSRVYRWYGKLRAVEQAIDDVPTDKRTTVYQEQLRRLDEIEEKANHVTIPLSFAEELYGLRSHINLVRKRILGLMQEQ
jgi:TRAP transporter TAXI family solute receptor